LIPCHRLRQFFKMEDRVCSDFFEHLHPP
jgi:hypothetical protein